MQAESEPKNNSAGFGKLSADSGVVPKIILESLIMIEALFFEEEFALL
jgi:hypothetical protein